MFTHVTRALLGTADLSGAEASRLHEAILHDNLVYNRALLSLIEERAPAVIAAMHPMERDALEKRINVVRNKKVTVKWAWLPDYQNVRNLPTIQVRRYFGDDPKPQETGYFALPDSVAKFASYRDPWIGTAPSVDVLAAFETWLKMPDSIASAALREDALYAEEGKQMTQNKALSGEVATSVNIQKGASRA